MFDDMDFPWIKFSILSICFMVLIWKMGGSLDMLWRFGFVLCAPVGVYFALAGKSMRSRN